jgi:hypothetical protein
MVLPMDDDENSRLERLSLTLLAAGVVAGMAALAAPAACGLLGSIIMAVCVGNAIAIQFIKPAQTQHLNHQGQSNFLRGSNVSK